ncbi:hypothetical protein CFP56_013395 [Quercus suber]|uniref:Uncharacterized protein n=1 Tax=Quercus suber TaxID=58331 RepID=A0AAW0KVZ5_QUESU
MEQQNLNPDFPKQLSIASLFPAYNSDTETDASSESNEIPPKLALYSNFIMSFYLARSQSDSIIVHTLMEYLGYSLIPKKKIHTVILFSSQVSDSSENDEIIQIRPTRHTILATSFKGLMGILLEATKNFSEDHKIGTGSLGSICHATLDAIKRAEISKSKPYESYVNDCTYHDNAFQSELKSSSRLNHKKLVP